MHPVISNEKLLYISPILNNLNEEQSCITDNNKKTFSSDWKWSEIKKSLRQDGSSRIFIWDSTQKTRRTILLLPD